MTYRLHFHKAARRDLKALTRDAQQAALAEIESLQEVPRPPGVKRLVGSVAWRIRISSSMGPLRALFLIDDSAQTVTILNVRHRKDAYD